jgi:type I restriction enzyme, R subunit
VKYRSQKKELIDKFIEEALAGIEDTDHISSEFEKFVLIQKNIAFIGFCKEEGINTDKFEKVLEKYLYTEKSPQIEEIIQTLEIEPKLKERKTVFERIK